MEMYCWGYAGYDMDPGRFTLSRVCGVNSSLSSKQTPNQYVTQQINRSLPRLGSTWCSILVLGMYP